MTVQTLYDHEALCLPYFERDYRRGSLERLVARHVRGPRVLDLRCLTGRLVVELAAEGMAVTALDAYPGCVERTNARARAQGLARPIAKTWGFSELLAHVSRRSFETVIALDTLNHVEDDVAMLADIARTLVPGGQVIATLPAHPALHGRRDDALGHLRRYTRTDARQLLEREGFRVVQLRPWNFTALPMYVLHEKVLRRGVSQQLRYVQDGVLGRWASRGLGWWYRVVENRFLFPVGLTWFVTAEYVGGPGGT